MMKKIGKVILYTVFICALVVVGKLHLRAFDAQMDQYIEDVRILIESKEAMERERYEHWKKYGTEDPVPVVKFYGSNPPAKKKKK